MLFQSCFTGIEGTKKIKLSKQDLSILTPTSEESLITVLKPDTLKNWHLGKNFYVTDSRISILMEQSAAPEILPGDTITFLQCEDRINPDGSTSAILVFNKDQNRYYLPLERSREKSLPTLLSTQLPLLIDLDLVEMADNLLKDKRVWLLTGSWLGDTANYIKGKKYQAATIKNVLPGDSRFPLRIKFETPSAETYFISMDFGNRANESRSFAKLFSLSDPRKSYPHISDENWEAICNETVRIGMTKDECRLSLGNPSEVNTGHDYSRALELWYYPNGAFLQFSDGILVNFR